MDAPTGKAAFEEPVPADHRRSARTHRITLFFTLFLTLLLLGLGTAGPASSGTAQTEEVAVVVETNTPFDTLSAATLKSIYTGQTEFAGKTRLTPFEYLPENPLRVRFLQRVIGMDPARFDAYWLKQIFRGNGFAPRRVASSAEMLTEVGHTPGGVGYVPVSALGELSGVREVLRIPLKN